MAADTPSADYRHNRQEYDQFWSARWRRHWTYSNQTKLRRFRDLMRREGLLGRDSLAVFDMGFGLGAMLFEFRPSCRLAGFELSPSAVAQAQAVAHQRGYAAADFRIFQPGLEYPVEWQGQFDVVISSHVLEHLQEPAPAMRTLLKLLRPGGHACLIVPINERPGDDINHFHHFTEASFRQFLEVANFEIVRLESCDRLMRLVLPIAKRRQQQPSAWVRVASLGLNAVLAPLPLPILRAADRMLGWFGCRETQCIALLRRRG